MKLRFLVFANCMIILAGCKKPETALPAISQFDFSISDTATARADGVSLIKLNGSVPAEASDSFRKMTFTATTLGIFVMSASQVADVNGKASAQVRTGLDSGLHLVTASIDGNANLKREITFYLKAAHPDQVLIDVNKSIADTTAGAPTEVTVYLRRSSGSVSKGLKVTGRAYQVRNAGIDTIAVGRMESLVSKVTDNTGTIKFNYHTDTRDIDATKIVTIEITALNDNGSPVRARYLLRVK